GPAEVLVVALPEAVSRHVDAAPESIVLAVEPDEVAALGGGEDGADVGVALLEEVLFHRVPRQPSHAGGECRRHVSARRESESQRCSVAYARHGRQPSASSATRRLPRPGPHAASSALCTPRSPMGNASLWPSPRI